jgi:hypothetical protein
MGWIDSPRWRSSYASSRQPELERGVVRAVLQEWTLQSIDLWAVFPTGRRVSRRHARSLRSWKTSSRKAVSTRRSAGAPAFPIQHFAFAR